MPAAGCWHTPAAYAPHNHDICCRAIFLLLDAALLLMPRMLPHCLFCCRCYSAYARYAHARCAMPCALMLLYLRALRAAVAVAAARD